MKPIINYHEPDQWIRFLANRGLQIWDKNIEPCWNGTPKEWVWSITVVLNDTLTAKWKHHDHSQYLANLAAGKLRPRSSKAWSELATAFILPKQCTVWGPQSFLKRCPSLCYWRCPALRVSPFCRLSLVSPKLCDIYSSSGSQLRRSSQESGEFQSLGTFTDQIGSVFFGVWAVLKL